MATVLIYPDRQSSSPNPDACNDPGLGNRPNFYGSLPQLFWAARHPILPRIVRGRLSTPLQRHYQPMVSTSRATHSSRCLVRYKWSCHDHRIGIIVWLGTYTFRDTQVLANVRRIYVVSIPMLTFFQYLPLCRPYHYRHCSIRLLETR